MLSFKAKLSAVEDWVSSHTHTMPDNLGPVTVRTMAHLMMSPDVYSWLETSGALGIRKLMGLDGRIAVIPPGGR